MKKYVNLNDVSTPLRRFIEGTPTPPKIYKFTPMYAGFSDKGIQRIIQRCFLCRSLSRHEAHRDSEKLETSTQLISACTKVLQFLANLSRVYVESSQAQSQNSTTLERRRDPTPPASGRVYLESISIYLESMRKVSQAPSQCFRARTRPQSSTVP